jgi:hypothetical protein
MGVQLHGCHQVRLVRLGLLGIFSVSLLVFLSDSLLFRDPSITGPLSSLRYWWEIPIGVAPYGNGVYVATARTMFTADWRASNAFLYNDDGIKGYSASTANNAEEWLEIKLPQVAQTAVVIFALCVGLLVFEFTCAESISLAKTSVSWQLCLLQMSWTLYIACRQSSS